MCFWRCCTINNFIEYFYGIKVNKYTSNNKYFSFIHNGQSYKLFRNVKDNDINKVYDINKNLIHRTLMCEIVLNKRNEIISNYNGISYMLVKSFINTNKNITLTEILLLSNSLYASLEKINWGVLWENKIDYLEELISENGLKYPIIVDSFNYFVGMTENAISYFNSIEIPSDYKYVINHKVIKCDDKIDILYDPLNIIFDYKVRDVAEYIKISFFNKNQNIFNELVLYLKYSNLSLVEVKLLISRLLYPSFYFELYEDILINSKEEKIILDIVSCLDEYEEYLDNIFSFLKQYFNMYENIDEILWLKKRRP